MLADVCFGGHGLKEYVERKQNIVRLYRSWQGVLDREIERGVTVNGESSKMDYVGNEHSQDHINGLFEEFINLSSLVVNKGYQRLFEHYQPNQFNLESVFVMNLTKCITEQLARKPSDYVLRAYFSKQIDFTVEYSLLL